MIGAKEYEDVYVGAGNYQKKPTLTEPTATKHDSGWQVGAYEPTTDIHGDIDYLYTLDLMKLTIIVQERIGDNKYKTLDTIKDFSELKPEPEPITDPEALEIV